MLLLIPLPPPIPCTYLLPVMLTYSTYTPYSSAFARHHARIYCYLRTPSGLALPASRIHMIPLPPFLTVYRAVRAAVASMPLLASGPSFHMASRRLPPLTLPPAFFWSFLAVTSFLSALLGGAGFGSLYIFMVWLAGAAAALCLSYCL
jgi:hypothetical protein